MLKNQKIHFIAIGGSVMHNLAICLKLLDNQVTGSDDMFFDPSKSNLKRHGLLPDNEGWHPERVHSQLDYVILGMHAKNDNPELLKAKDLGLKIYSFPEFIHEVSKEKIRLVVAGSHGKTSITSMILHVLNKAGKSFDYLVGAQLEGFDTMVKISDAPMMIIEGDEYTTSPLDLTPKFLHYNHHFACITGIAWDHFNVFPTLDIYEEQFLKFINQTPNNGKVFYAEVDQALCKIVERAEPNEEQLIPYNAFESKIEDNQTIVLWEGREIPLQVFGDHNLQNLNAARLLLNQVGISDDEFFEHIQSFTGASKRLELIGQNDFSTIYKDFAHAPSKLKATSEAVTKQFKDRKLTSVLELHTFSSLNKQFIHQYEGCYDLPQQAIVFINPEAVKAKKLEMISEDELVDAFKRKDLKLFTDAEKLEQFILSQDWNNRNLLLMSSGNFGGLDIEKIKDTILS
ncbi:MULTISPECIES: UDP-N-acetylmuramate--L-alanine ligase [Roseivirga]|jgi:UDP-N-acetylmuramate: L-alanyl-gamma-D-glutamyl-meso-diaminopimelate ligase|uniref:Peptidoglycan synthetase n=1 Tax=Roseivirga spongicola TaxID=333140 RepID=A0A150X1B3_9BACT|nr:MULTISPECIES: Mur ligase family protein [Roseivirga]KYG72533.1 peptidoglycan synthetase [Roseivirga spongicola]MBO6659474.1 peptidoglycan synthetase [Roseivirga sp.]MBO6907789.1 peptidoglycan synthetase [Roseivirga sp.]WPZ10129.1 Mur ligase family protein [Roseivirga spongicola]